MFWCLSNFLVHEATFWSSPSLRVCQFFHQLMGRSVMLEMLLVHLNVSCTAAHRGRRCLWFYNIGTKLTRSGQSEDKCEQIVTVKLAVEFVPGQLTGLWFWALNRGGHPCLSPLCVLGVALGSTAWAQASMFQAALRCLRLEGLPETQHCSLQFLPPFHFDSVHLTPPCPGPPFRYAAQLLSLCTVTITIYSQQLAF